MAAPLKASLQLTLEDKLTAGLGKLKQQLEALRDLAGSLGLGELENALERLRGDSVDNLANGLKGISRQADTATRSLQKLQAANENIISVNSNGVARLNRSLGSLVVIPGGGGGGRGGGGASGGMPLLLPGPGGEGGIPLNLRPAAGAGLASAGKGVLAATGGLSEAANGAMSGAMRAAMEGFAVYEPIKAYAGFENILRHIAISEKLSGAAADAEITRLNTLLSADALAAGQTSESIARAYSEFVQVGMSAKTTDQIIGAHSRAATAYNISPEALGPAVGALLQNMKIPEADIGSAISAMAYASKEGRFKVSDFSLELPGTTGYLSLLGMTGRKNADVGFAALETVMKNSSQPGQAAAYFNDALHYITSPIAKRSFAKAGIDLPGLERNAAKQGISPLDAVLGKMSSMIVGMNTNDASFKLGALLHNQGAGVAIVSLLQHKDEFLALRKTLDGVNKSVADTDFATAFAAPVVQMRLLGEQLEQLNRILGQGFLPALKIVGVLLTGLLTSLIWLNDNFPNVTKYVLGTAGAFLTLAAGVGVFKVVAPIFKASWTVITSVLEFAGAIFDGLIAVMGAMLSPIGLVVGAVGLLAAAAYGIYAHWGNTGHFFADLWTGVMGTFDAFVTWVDSWTAGLGTRILDGIKKGWSLLVDGFGLLIKDLESKLTGGLIGRFYHLAETPQLSGMPSGDASPTSPQIAGRRADSLDVRVSAEPGTKVTNVQASNPNHTVSKPNTGQTLGRP